MAKVVIEKWQCDLCKTIEDERPNVPFPRFTMRYEEEEEWYSDVVKLSDLCVKCNSKVREVVKLLYGKD